MKKLTIGFALFLGLLFTSSLQAQTYGEAAAAKAAAEAAYADASEGYGAVSALVADINALLDGLSEEEIGEELWDALDSAWEAIEDADSLYGEGDYWASYGMASWNNYDPEGDPESQLVILGDIIANFSNSCDCYTDAADDYEDLEDECGDLYTDSLVKSMNVWIGKMQAAKLAMNIEMGQAMNRYNDMVPSWNGAWDAWSDASVYTPINQVPYDAAMTAGTESYNAGDGLRQAGDGFWGQAEGIGAGMFGAYAREGEANNAMLDAGTRRQSADTATTKFLEMTGKYVAARLKYVDAKGPFDDAKSAYEDAQTK